MPLAVWVAGGIVALLGVGLGLWYAVGRRPAAPADGLVRCRACRGTGAVRGADTRSGYGMCDGCHGTGWARG